MQPLDDTSQPERGEAKAADLSSVSYLDQVLSDLEALNAAVVSVEAAEPLPQSPEAVRYLQRMQQDIGRINPGMLTAGFQLPKLPGAKSAEEEEGGKPS